MTEPSVTWSPAAVTIATEAATLALTPFEANRLILALLNAAYDAGGAPDWAGVTELQLLRCQEIRAGADPAGMAALIFRAGSCLLPVVLPAEQLRRTSATLAALLSHLTGSTRA